MLKFLTRTRGRTRLHWTDWLTYAYLCVGLFTMFAPILWLVMSSFKTESAISQFPDRIIQNEKNPGVYRQIVGEHRLAGSRGLLRDANDRVRAARIEHLLCSGDADASCLLAEPASMASLHQLEERRLVVRDGSFIKLTEAGRPYARIVAALFDSSLPEVGAGSLAA